MTPDEANQRKSSPQIPADMKTFNEKLIAEFRANGGKLSGPVAGSQLLLLTTMGRKSGKERTTVIGYRRDGDRLVAIASGNGAPMHPAWYLNLQNRPIATVELGTDKFKVRARTASAEERDHLKSVVTYLEPQQALTTREIPIVVFERG